MNTQDILHLSTLARMEISEEEAVSLGKDIDAVLEYVSVVNEITAESGAPKKVGAVYNVFREDAVTVEPGSFTQALMNEAPSTKNDRLQVKQILNAD
ncbi:MAG: aspartyl/glutamyl-tRNA(Asn/Gln) amidotransferase C subunit [Patiriisocius sp.]|jgi:aspartyl/glutamyl-tRNA(Asn/Gln) amidotransferase C subunit